VPAQIGLTLDRSIQ